MVFVMEAPTMTPTAPALPHVVFMTAEGAELFHVHRTCAQLPGSADDIYAVGRASATAVGRIPCPECLPGFTA